MNRPRKRNTPRSIQRLLRNMQRLMNEMKAMMEAAERLGALPDEPLPPGLKEITPTEFAVWQRITAEQEDKYENIRPVLNMTKRTFDKHVNSLFGKLGVHTRYGAMRKWMALGMDGRMG